MKPTQKEHKQTNQLVSLFGAYDPNYGGFKIRCPFCDDDYVHLEEVEKISGDDGYKASKKVRGDVIVIKGWAECGHGFNLYFGFHKGQTIFWCESAKCKMHELQKWIEDKYNEETT